jgi:ABC-type uncharacterized transport system permease subunit
MSNLSLNLALYLGTFLAYGALAVIFWRAQAAGHVEELERGVVGHAVLFPLLLQGYLLYQSLFIEEQMNLGLVYSVSLILWLTMLVHWVARFFYPIASLQTLVLPLAAIGALLPVLFPATHLQPRTASVAFEAHILVAMLAYSLFTIAVLHAGLMSLVEKRLHHAILPRVLHNLPPLLTMEALLFRIIVAGFLLLSFTLASGMIFSEELFGHALQFTPRIAHKIVFGLMSWAVFAVLLAGHHFYGWRGRTAIRWTISGFVFLLLAYVGSKFVMEVLLHR